MSVPYLSPTVRGEALEKAHQIRSLRYQLRTEIKEGRITLQEILDKSEDEVIGKMRVKYLLESLPDVGRAKAAKAMEDIGIAALRRIQGLGERQKAELIQRFVIDIAEKEAVEQADFERKNLDKCANAERKLAETVRKIEKIAERKKRAEDALLEAAAMKQTLTAEKAAVREILAAENAKAEPVLAKAAAAERTLAEDIAWMDDILREEEALNGEKNHIRTAVTNAGVQKARLDELNARIGMLEERKSLAKATLAESRALAKKVRAEKNKAMRSIAAAERALRGIVSSEEKLLLQKSNAEKALAKAKIAEDKVLVEKSKREAKLAAVMQKYKTFVDTAER